MIVISFCIPPLLHAAAGRGCTRAVQATIHVAPENDTYEKIEQLGGLEIGDNVEIGSGCTIDRGTISNTIISNGVKLDNPDDERVRCTYTELHSAHGHCEARLLTTDGVKRTLVVFVVLDVTSIPEQKEESQSDAITE